MMMENLGEILIAAGILLLAAAVLISLAKAPRGEDGAADFPDCA